VISVRQVAAIKPAWTQPEAERTARLVGDGVTASYSWVRAKKRGVHERRYHLLLDGK
jgi:hypothetical protein